MHLDRRLALVLAIIALTAPLGAQQALRDLTLPQDPLFEAAIERGSRTREGRPGAALWRHEIRYAIEAELDIASADLSGTVRIDFKNGSPAAIDRLPIHLRQNIQLREGRRIEKTGGVRLEQVSLRQGAGEASVIEPEVEGTVMTIALPQPLATGDSLQVEISWKHKVPLRGAPRQGRVGDELFYLGYWYPQVAVQDDIEGWVADQYKGTGEFYMPYADYEIAFTLPENYVVQATGRLLNAEEVLPKAQRVRLAAAAKSDEVISVVSAEELEKGGFTVDAPDDRLTWRFKAENVRDVAVSCGRNYVWDALRARVPGRDDVCMIHSFYRPDQEGWKKSAIAGRHAVEFGSRLFPYPWPHMSLCEGASGGGMEYPMMTTIAAGNNPRSVANVIIHETIHMWFPMIAGSNEKRYAWMDEGMTSCLTAVAAGELFEDDRDVRGALEGYRVMRGRMDETEPMMTHGDAYTSRGGYGIASYSKPSAVYHQLRLMIGDELFYAALRDYLGAWAFKHPRPEDFFATFSRVAERDLDWYFREWFYETWKLDLAIERVKLGETRSQVLIAAKGRAIMPTEVEVKLEDGTSHRIEVDLGSLVTTDRIILDVEGRVAELKIDPDDHLLDVDRKNNVWKP